MTDIKRGLKSYRVKKFQRFCNKSILSIEISDLKREPNLLLFTLVPFIDPIQSMFELHFELHEPRYLLAVAVTQNGFVTEHCAFEEQATHILLFWQTGVFPAQSALYNI